MMRQGQGCGVGSHRPLSLHGGAGIELSWCSHESFTGWHVLLVPDWDLHSGHQYWYPYNSMFIHNCSFFPLHLLPSCFLGPSIINCSHNFLQGTATQVLLSPGDSEHDPCCYLPAIQDAESTSQPPPHISVALPNGLLVCTPIVLNRLPIVCFPASEVSWWFVYHKGSE